MVFSSSYLNPDLKRGASGNACFQSITVELFVYFFLCEILQLIKFALKCHMSFYVILLAFVNLETFST